MGSLKKSDWVPPEREKTGRRGGNRDAILRGKSEIEDFVTRYNASATSAALRAELGWSKGTYDSTVRRLRRLGYPLKEFKAGRPVGSKNAPGVKVGHVAPKPVLPAAALEVQQRVESTSTEASVYKRYEPELDGNAEKKQAFAAALVANHLSVKRTCQTMGVSTATYYKWMREDPAFGAMVKQACQEISDEAVSVGVKLAFGEDGRPDASMVRWVAEKMNPERFSREVRHVHSGTIGHAALQSMTPEEKQVEFEKLMRLRGPIVVEDGEIVG